MQCITAICVLYQRKPEDTELAADDAKKPKTVDTEAVNTTDEPATVSDPSQADEPMATSEPTEEVRLDSEPAETPVVVNGCPETVQVNGDAEIKVTHIFGVTRFLSDKFLPSTALTWQSQTPCGLHG